MMERDTSLHVLISYAIIGLVLTKCTLADDDGGQPNTTAMVPCNTTSGIENCTSAGESGTILTTEVIQSTTFPSAFPPTQTSPKPSENDNEDPPWFMDNSLDIDKYLDLPATKEYIDSFTDEFQKMLIKETLRHCPFMNLCNFSLGLDPLTFFLFIGEPCCTNCSCHSDCVSEGNCCPDYRSLTLTLASSDIITETCMAPSLQYVKPRYTIKAIQSCPSNTNENLQLRCSGNFASFSNITLDDVIPVSDSATLRTYRNRHCAKCNDVNEATMTTWTSFLGCWEPPSFSTTEELILGILDGRFRCEIEFIEPSFVEVESCNHVISKCNETGMWVEFDPEVYRACGLYGTTIGVHHDMDLLLFKNPFCATCNGMNVSESEYMCYDDQPSSGDPGVPYAFSGLLRLEPTKSKAPDSLTEITCGQGLLFDDIQKRCRKVTCPFNNVFKNGLCEQFLETTDLFGYRMFSIVRPSVDITVLDLYNIMPTTNIDEEINKYICTKQSMIVLKDFTGSINASLLVDSIEMMYDILPDTELEDNVEGLLALDGMNITVNTSLGDVILFHVILKDSLQGYDTHAPYYQFDNWDLSGSPVPLEDLLNIPVIAIPRTLIPYFNYGTYPGDCFFPGPILRVLTMRPCPTFSLNRTEFGLIETSYGLKSTTGGNILVRLSEYVIDDKYPFVRVCVDTYKRVFKDYFTHDVIHALSSVYSAELIVSIVSVSVSIVSLIISLFAYCYLPQIQTLPGKNNMALIVALLLAQGMYILSSYGRFDTDSFSCKLVGGLTHFFWLLSIFWMNLCTFHMFRVLVRTRNVSGMAPTNKHILYHAYAIVLSLVFVAVNVLVSMVTSDSSDIGYGGSRCYVSSQRMLEITFGIPATIVVIANMSMFLTIIVKLKRAPTVNKNVKHERNYVIVFAKLSTITGVTWLFGFVYMWTGIVAFSYIFTIFNGSQGLFLMVSFVCNTRTVGMVKDRSKALTSSFTRTHSTNTRPGSVHSANEKTETSNVNE